MHITGVWLIRRLKVAGPSIARFVIQKKGSLQLRVMSTDLSCAKILDNSKNTCETNSGYPKFYVLNSQQCNFMVGRITGKNTTCMQEWKMSLDCAPYGSFILG